MSNRFVPFLLVAAAFAYACGPRSPVGDSPARRPEAGQRPLAATFDVKVSEGVALDFRVVNGSARKVEVSFPSGLTHDFEVQDTLGRVMWRWSEGRLFTQSMQNRVLEHTEALAFSASWTPPELHGEYVAVVSLKSTTHPIEQRTRFTLP